MVAGLFLFVWLYLEPTARYCASAPVFFLRADFLRQHLNWPGGPLAYSAAFLAQSDYHAWLGALVFTLLVGLICLAARRLSGGGGGDIIELAWAVPGCLLLVLHAHYSPPVLGIGFGVLLAVSSLLGWSWRAPASGAWRWIGFGLVAATLFYLAGPFPSLLFIVIAGLHEWAARRDWRPACGCWLAILPWLLAASYGEFSGLQTTVRAWGNAASVTAVVLLYGFFPVAMVARELLPGGSQSPQRQRSHPAATGRSASWPSPPRRTSGRRVWAIRAALGALAAAVFVGTFDFQRRALLRIQSAAERRDWPRALAAAAPLRTLPVPARLQVNRALFHTGRLTNDLLKFPQPAGADLLSSLADGPDVCLPLCDTLLELGQVNLAEHYAQEAVEVRGEQPAVLWRLAQINLVKERPLAARVYLNVLQSVPFHRIEARRWLRLLDRDPGGGTVEGIAQLRAVRTRSDMVEYYFPTEVLLRQLLQANRQNKMAAEYLMAQQLLEQRTGRVVTREQP
jgi:hypothetical protein